MTSGKNTLPTLCWPGKTRRHSRVVAPLLLRELHQERQDAPGAWRNLLVHADNLPLLSSLCYGPLRKELEKHGGIKLVYCDPPFAVGGDFTLDLPEGKTQDGGEGDLGWSGGANGSGARLLAYRDRWENGLSGFLNMMYARLLLMRELLAPDGSLYLHCDRRTAPHLRLILDEIFGPERFLGDIVWHYTGGGRSKRWFSRKHDRILHYAASGTWYFNPDAVRVPYKPTSGYAKGGITSARGKHYSPNPLGTPPDDVWDIPMINPLALERCGYPTQKPLALMERIILASSRPGDIVADFFCGSGTTALCAGRLGRSWIAVDSGAPAIHACRKRLATDAFEAAGPSREHAPGPYALARLGAPRDMPGQAGQGHGKQGAFTHEARLAEGCIRYTVSGPELRLEWRDRAVSLELAGFAVSPAQEGALGAPADGRAARSAGTDGLFRKGDWREWLNYWSIGLYTRPSRLPEGMLPDAYCAEILWESRRSRKRALSLQSPFLELPGPPETSGPVLVVGIVDVFCNQSMFVLDKETL